MIITEGEGLVIFQNQVELKLSSRKSDIDIRHQTYKIMWYFFIGFGKPGLNIYQVGV